MGTDEEVRQDAAPSATRFPVRAEDATGSHGDIAIIGDQFDTKAIEP